MQIYCSVYQHESVCVVYTSVLLWVYFIEWEINRSNMYTRIQCVGAFVGFFFVCGFFPYNAVVFSAFIDRNFRLSKWIGECIRKLTSTPPTNIWWRCLLYWNGDPWVCIFCFQSTMFGRHLVNVLTINNLQPRATLSKHQALVPSCILLFFHLSIRLSTKCIHRTYHTVQTIDDFLYFASVQIVIRLLECIFCLPFTLSRLPHWKIIPSKIL